MKIMCQEYFDAVVRYAESIGDCTLQECLDRLERWGQNARQASEIEHYRDFAPYSFRFKQLYADDSLGVVGGLVYHARRIVPAAIRWKRSMDGPFTLESLIVRIYRCILMI